MLSMHEDDAYFFEALEAGASGYVSKRAADGSLIDAIRTVAGGDTFLSSAHPADAAQAVARGRPHRARATSSRRASSRW